jgi:hypothetical protein
VLLDPYLLLKTPQKGNQGLRNEGVYYMYKLVDAECQNCHSINEYLLPLEIDEPGCPFCGGRDLKTLPTGGHLWDFMQQCLDDSYYRGIAKRDGKDIGRAEQIKKYTDETFTYHTNK